MFKNNECHILWQTERVILVTILCVVILECALLRIKAVNI